ncbi:peptidoglycan recognition protein family protein [Roseibium sediminis]|uniref:peptidoglycan recognition protein family protein n=1 Tax=Roseibium sediminis TaxID=1775174 RepID=UPI00123E00F6|nr:N-acetylmuramoyl-L-alanine amidase [Roseibium sediminis]
MNRKQLGQSLNLKIEMVAPGRPNRSGKKINPQYITIHNTSNTSKGADADAHSNLIRNKGYYMWKGEKRYVSWHYTVDDNKVIKHIPIWERAIHAGKGNGQSIAIEVCMNQGINQQAANDRAARLVACLLHDLKLNKSRIVPHKHWTGKNCPILLLPNFASFCSQCESHLDAIDLSSSGSSTDEPQDGDMLLVTAEEMEIIKALDEELLGGAMAEDGPEDEDPDDEHTLIAQSLSELLSEEENSGK